MKDLILEEETQNFATDIKLAKQNYSPEIKRLGY
jgi:hypothetical protein